MYRLLILALVAGALLEAQQTSTSPKGAPLRLIEPAEAATEMKLPKPAEKNASDPAVRPAILKLKPPSNPIYVEEQPPDPALAEQDKWRTYQRPKVDRISRDGEGIALHGYDILSYLEDGQADIGKEQFTVEYGGVTWRFTTAEHRDRFRQDPEAFQPQYGGFCAYSLGRGYPATADPKTFSVRDGKLYLFFNRAAQLVWEQDTAKMLQAADRYWPRLHR